MARASTIAVITGLSVLLCVSTVTATTRTCAEIRARIAALEVSQQQLKLLVDEHDLQEHRSKDFVGTGLMIAMGIIGTVGSAAFILSAAYATPAIASWSGIFGGVSGVIGGITTLVTAHVQRTDATEHIEELRAHERMMKTLYTNREADLASLRIQAVPACARPRTQPNTTCNQ